MSLGCWKKPGHLEETHTGTREHAILQRKVQIGWFKLAVRLCTTVHIFPCVDISLANTLCGIILGQ